MNSIIDKLLLGLGNSIDTYLGLQFLKSIQFISGLFFEILNLKDTRLSY